jgi:hypothetical protein
MQIPKLKTLFFFKGGIHVVDHVLRNTNGKILRRVLAEQFQQEAAKSEAEIEEDILKGKLAVEPRLEPVAALSDKGRM